MGSNLFKRPLAHLPVAYSLDRSFASGTGTIECHPNSRERTSWRVSRLAFFFSRLFHLWRSGFTSGDIVLYYTGR